MGLEAVEFEECYEINWEETPMVELSNGLVVANFSSPHSFTFTTGEVLGACAGERAKALMLESEEIETTRAVGLKHQWTDIELKFSMSAAVEATTSCSPPINTR